MVLDLGAGEPAEVLRVRLDIVNGALVVEDHHGLSVRVSRRFHGPGEELLRIGLLQWAIPTDLDRNLTGGALYGARTRRRPATGGFVGVRRVGPDRRSWWFDCCI
jgi:hypothetical protein